ncbi:MAG: YciI family protein [Rhodospirillaceae bacterium]|nr:YciI family protein [Rhodospirillaceae bacterium]
MLFAVLFTDDPRKLHIRLGWMKRHLAFLKRYRKEILVAGSLRDRPQDSPKGALWIVEAECVDRVKELIARDPFSRHGLRKRVTVRHWNKAFARKRAI